MKKIAIIGFHFQALKANPLDTLVGIRVRTWALFEQLPRYGFEVKLWVEKGIYIDGSLQAYEPLFERDENVLIAQANRGEFDAVVLCATNIAQLVQHLPWLKELDCPILGAFCYDMNNDEIPKNILKNLMGVTFTTPLQKAFWDDRGTDIPSLLITTGQSTQAFTVQELNQDAIFIGELRSLRVVKLLCDIAQATPHRNYYLVTPKIIEQLEQNKVYLDFATYPKEKQAEVFKSFLAQQGWAAPPNLIYQYIPHGEEESILKAVKIGLDFSWGENYRIENSKVSRYLTYGLAVVAELPSPSFRYLPFFGMGEVVPYEASPQAWITAIEKAANTPLATRQKVHEAALPFFAWERVTFEVASFLWAYNEKKKYTFFRKKLRTLLSKIKKLVKK
jgi:hypothetical protein